MRFMIMYKPVGDPESGPPPSPEYLAEMNRLIVEGMKSGSLLAAEGLQPSSKGARVRLSEGKVTVTDGPFTESKELIAGFSIVKASSKEEAIEMARNFLKVAGDGETEVRQIYEASDFGPA